MRLTHILAPASALGRGDSEWPSGSERAALGKVMTQGSLDNLGERRTRHLSPDVAFYGLRKIIRHSHSGTLHRGEL
jgi:hypothetical protein